MEHTNWTCWVTCQTLDPGWRQPSELYKLDLTFQNSGIERILKSSREREREEEKKKKDQEQEWSQTSQ